MFESSFWLKYFFNFGTLIPARCKNFKMKHILYLYLPTFGSQKFGHFHHCSNPPPPPAYRTACQSFPSNPADSLDTDNLGRGTPKYINCAQSAFHTEIHELVYKQFRSIKEFSFQFEEKRAGKILIYILNATVKTKIFNDWNSWKFGRPIFGGFEGQKSELSW